MANIKKKMGKLSPCPDPDNYVLVISKEGNFWRRKRGTIKPAKLNDVLKKNAQLTPACSKAAKHILLKLAIFTSGLDKGRIHSKITGILCKSMNKNGSAGYDFAKGLEMQPSYPLHDILKGHYTVILKKRTLTITIPLQLCPVKRNNKLVTAFYFDAVLICGDPTKARALRIDAETSEKYSFDKTYKDPCVLQLQLPDNKPWMIWLKAGCMEGTDPAHHPKHYGMKVVEVGVG